MKIIPDSMYTEFPIPMSDRIQDSAPNCERKSVHTNESEKSVTGYTGGHDDGTVTTWYETGAVCATGKFNDGKLDGIISKWNRDGNVEWKVEFDSGKFIRVLECPASEETFIRLSKILYISPNPARGIIDWAGFPTT
jgi:hypothetical protein